MSESKSDYPHIRDKSIDLSSEQALFIEYQEAGEEFRNYEQLLNQSYYLSAIVLTFFMGALANLLNQDPSSKGIVIALAFIASFTFLVLGLAGRAYHKRRKAAARIRDQIAADIHELTDSNVPRIQKVVVGGGNVKIDKNSESRERDIRSRFTLWKGSLLLSTCWLLFIPAYILL